MRHAARARLFTGARPTASRASKSRIRRALRAQRFEAKGERATGPRSSAPQNCLMAPSKLRRPAGWVQTPGPRLLRPSLAATQFVVKPPGSMLARTTFGKIPAAAELGMCLEQYQFAAWAAA